MRKRRPSVVGPIFFATGAEFRAWLQKHHATETELWVGMHKKASGRPSMTWPEAVDEALCFGWIDGIRKSFDEHSYVNRFTPRKKRSNWSLVNIAKVEALIRAGRMRGPGLAAYQAREMGKSGVYSFERAAASFTSSELKAFRGKKKAWQFWESQPPGYRRIATHWVVSAKRPETREKRLKAVIADSAAGLRIALLRRTAQEGREGKEGRENIK